ncbi:MAG: formate dehydrogenase subunit delta [Alphaproteobacteria bacterium]|nr:formate dehydrogenase subunit delta [Alphaproteobacteria bacterium]
MSGERLVMMANQIGRFFAHEGERAPASLARHIRGFLDPRMRAGILQHLDAGSAGLDPALREALHRLRVPADAQERVAVGEAGDKTACR